MVIGFLISGVTGPVKVNSVTDESAVLLRFTHCIDVGGLIEMTFILSAGEE